MGLIKSLNKRVQCMYTGSRKYSNASGNFIYIFVLYKTFWNFIDAVTGHDHRDYIGQIWNGPENVYRSCKIFIESMHFVKVIKAFIYYTY